MRNFETTLLFKWFQQVWNEGNENAIDELFSVDGIAYGVADEINIKGPEEFKSFYNGFRKQFSNINVIVGDVISQDEVESARCIVDAIHIDSGKKVHFTGICMAKISNGKIIEGWNNFDFLKMNQQIGLTLTNEASS
jgi:hypothetical protein